MKVTVFPYDFEFIPILRNREMLKDIEIIGVAAPKGFGLSNKDAFCLSQRERSDYIVKDMISEEEYKKIDAVWIADSIMKIPLEEQSKMIESIAKHKKNIIFTAEDINVVHRIQTVCEKHKVKYLGRDVFRDHQDRIDGSKSASPSQCHKFKTPIVTVYGIAPMTQKFDIQLYLRKNLLEAGYKVSQIGSKALGELFGFYSWEDILYNNYYSEYEKIMRLNQFISDIEEKEKPDVMILGVPGGIMPFNKKHTFQFAIQAYEISNAVTSDFSILSLSSGQYSHEFYEEMKRIFQYKFNTELDAFYISHFVPVSASIDTEQLSYAYIEENIGITKQDNVFDKYALNEKGMYDLVIEKLSDYGKYNTF